MSNILITISQIPQISIGSIGISLPTYSTMKHIVKASQALTKGNAVYISSATGSNMIASKASASQEITSSKTLGLIAQNLSVNGQGYVITEGLLSGLNTSTATIGDSVWLSTTAGELVYGYTNRPLAPNHLVFIGIVTRVHQNQGEIFVKVQNGFELEELHNVSISNVSVNNIIRYDGTKWINSTLESHPAVINILNRLSALEG